MQTNAYGKAFKPAYPVSNGVIGLSLFFRVKLYMDVLFIHAMKLFQINFKAIAIRLFISNQMMKQFMI
ncbi:hypothetical protein D6N97_17680 [Salmonella enterica]|nr:hypothetical protein [Salmonella enterica]